MKPRKRLQQLGACLALIVLPGAAIAEMYRCVNQNGEVTFTDNAAACPGAAKHTSQGRLQEISSGSDPVPAAPETPLLRSAPDPAADQNAQKAHWQQKKLAAEEELRAHEERRLRLARVVTGCNRGAEILTRDSTGIEYEVPCDDIRREHAEAGEQAERLRKYLASGLRRECRQAGCLPGWIR